jgi:hypothetical protein
MGSISTLYDTGTTEIDHAKFWDNPDANHDRVPYHITHRLRLVSDKPFHAILETVMPRKPRVKETFQPPTV